jgi:hypothetical protein
MSSKAITASSGLQSKDYCCGGVEILRVCRHTRNGSKICLCIGMQVGESVWRKNWR